MILDIGCGRIPLTSKRVEVIHVDINRRGKHLEVLCDAQHLPFKDKSFKIVHASHILEHVDNPLAVLREIRRICNGLAIIKIPNVYGRTIEDQTHLYSWNRDTFNHLLSKVFSHVEIKLTMRTVTFKRPPLRWISKALKWMIASLFQPNELTAICY